MILLGIIIILLSVLAGLGGLWMTTSNNATIAFSLGPMAVNVTPAVLFVSGMIVVALLGLGELLFGDFAVAELDGFIAFLFPGHLLHDHAGAGFDDGDGNDLTGLVEDLRHADLLADDGFLH